MTIDAENHLGLAYWSVRNVNAPDLDDVRQESVLGLLRAALKHDPARGSFSSLAVLLCRRSGFEEVYRQRRLAERETSLYVTGEDSEERERPGLPYVDPHGDSGLMALRLREALAELPEREREVLVRHFGMSGQGEALQAIGDALKLSRHRVGQIEARALRRLRRILSKRRVAGLRPACPG